MAIGIVKGLAGTRWAPPVGFVWKSASPTSPANIYAGTTWTQLKDRAIIAAGGSYSNGSTGGSATHAMSTAEMPAHSHSGSTSSSGGHSHSSITSKTSKTGNYWNDVALDYTSMEGGSSGIVNSSANTATSGSHSHSASINATGSGQAFSILNPYIVRYMWERIG